MRRSIAVVTAEGFLALALVLAPAAGAFAQTPGEKLEMLLVEGANTAAEHQALAEYYRGKAAEARSHAEHHRAMAKRYPAYKGVDMRKHCEKLVTLNEQTAAEYDELAKGEEAEAAK